MTASLLREAADEMAGAYVTLIRGSLNYVCLECDAVSVAADKASATHKPDCLVSRLRTAADQEREDNV